MKKAISILIALLLLPIAFAAQTRLEGDITLGWSNSPNRPQQFVGSITGGLSGTMSLESNTDYDLTSANVGVTWSKNVVITTTGYTCDGFYAGANVNGGRDSGTFTLSCDNGDMLQGVIYGVNNQNGNMNLKYSAFLVTPIQGIQGLQGIKGDKGDQGIQGLQGEKGLQGEQGIQGLQGIKGDKGDQGIQGLQGEKGLQGDKGDQGIQGLQGEIGLQGIQGEQGTPADPVEVSLIKEEINKLWTDDANKWTAIHALEMEIEFIKESILNVTYYVDFKSQDLKNYIDGGLYDNCDLMDKGECSNPLSVKYKNFYCAVGQGTDKQCNKGKCAVKTTTTSCQYGCANGACKKPVYESCDSLPHATKCVSNSLVTEDYYCKSGKGTNSKCLQGNCVKIKQTNYCAGSCVNGECKSPLNWTDATCQSWCKAGYSIPQAICNKWYKPNKYVNDNNYCGWTQ